MLVTAFLKPQHSLQALRRSRKMYVSLLILIREIDLREAQIDSEKAIKNPRSHSLTYAFSVVMGGLAVDVSDIHNHLSTVVLSPAGD